jgi:hypothetical protein
MLALESSLEFWVLELGTSLVKGVALRQRR